MNLDVDALQSAPQPRFVAHIAKSIVQSKIDCAREALLYPKLLELISRMEDDTVHPARYMAWPLWPCAFKRGAFGHLRFSLNAASGTGLFNRIATIEDIDVKLQYDFFYIKYFSFWLDVLIVMRTIHTILKLRLEVSLPSLTANGFCEGLRGAACFQPATRSHEPLGS